MISLLAAIGLSVSPAFAAAPTTAAISDAGSVYTFGELLAEQQRLERELAAEKAKCPAGCKSAASTKPAPKATVKAATPEPPVPATPPVTVVSYDDSAVLARIVALEEAIDGNNAALVTLALNDQHTALEISQIWIFLHGKVSAEELDQVWSALRGKASRAELEELADRVALLEARPVSAPSHDTVTYVNGNRLTVGADVVGIVAEPLPGKVSWIGGRVDVFGQYAWDIEHNLAAALLVEVGVLGNNGVSIRGIPTLLFDSGIGIGAGAGYTCDGLWTDSNGCSAEHTGGLGQLSYQHGDGAFGFHAKAGAEVNYVQVPDSSGFEVRGFAGVGVFFGSTGTRTVSVD